MKPSRRFLSVLALVTLLAVFDATAYAGTTVVCLGDSLTEGYGVAPEDSYPSLLQRHFDAEGLEVNVVNAGVSGATSASAVSRLRWQLRGEPDIVVVALGANDGLRGVEPASTRKNLQSLIGVAREAGVRVVLAGMKLPPNYGPDYLREFERIFPELAKENDLPLIPFLLEGVAADPALNLADGIHPNAEGYRVVVQNVLSTLAPLVAEARP